MAELHDECWADYEDAIGPPPGAAARIRARVDRAVARRDEVVAEPEQVPRAAAVILVMKSSAISVAIAFAGLGGLHLAARAIAPTPAELPAPVVATAEPARAPIDEAPKLAAASIPPSAAAPSVAPAIAAPPVVRPHASKPAPAPTPVVDTLAEETALVARARAAMDRKAYADALQLFGEHAKRFPSGVLVPEREAYSAIARCKSGAKGSILATFTKAHPRSQYTDRVREACEDSSTDRSAPTE